MNKRILELAKQASIVSQSENDVAPPMEQFALLIIEECANLFTKTFTDEQYQRRIDKTIKKHFGIIE